jgi:hypothetical protein
MYVSHSAHPFTFTFSVFCYFLHNVFIILMIFHFWVVTVSDISNEHAASIFRIERITPTWTLE